MAINFFTGSYNSEDVVFLLKPIKICDTPIHLKEKLIQSGKKHYSELLTHEQLPPLEYITLFHQAMALNQQRMAKDLLYLAARIVANKSSNITLVSLARAGTPIGVLLKHILKQHYAINAPHYSISLLRDKGIDTNALHYLIRHHASSSLVFIDGWTGKGVIARQLSESLHQFSVQTNITIPVDLYVLADLSGSASVAATSEDYLIPSCLLNATISGLVSRSIYRPTDDANTDFHGCVFYDHYKADDLSHYFVQSILKTVSNLARTTVIPNDDEIDRAVLQDISKYFLHEIKQYYGISHEHYIKPGIGEATRVLLRREAKHLILREPHNEATHHLRWLAQTKSIPIDVRTNLPYQAAALIKEI